MKLEDSITYFSNNKNRTKYNFKNLINILRNKAKDNDVIIAFGSLYLAGEIKDAFNKIKEI